MSAYFNLKQNSLTNKNKCI